MYGGSTTSILMNVPGEAASVVTCIDGYQMARQGRAGAALGMSAFASFIAGTFGVLGLMLIGPPLARFALRFGPPEYFALTVVGLTLVSYLGGTSMLKGLSMAALGLLVGSVGIDPISGYQRFTYGLLTLSEGISFVPVAMGLFGVGEVLASAGEPAKREILKTRLSGLLPTRDDWARGHRGGCRPRGGQQLRGDRGLRPPLHAGPALQRRHGHDLRRPPAPRAPTGPPPLHREPGPDLGRDRLHVHRERHAARAEPAAHRALRPDAPGALSDPGPPHHPLLPGGGLQRQQQPRGCLDPDRLRDPGLLR